MHSAKLIFEDTFDGTEIDPAKWARCPEWPRQGKSHWKDRLAYVDGKGHLILRMEWDEETKLVNCGAVWTKGLYEDGYGYYEARVKFSPHHGAWGAFWLMCGNMSSEGNGAVDGVEIDVIESIGNQDGTYNHALHWNGYGPALKSYHPVLQNKRNIYDGEFHTFGVLRSADGYFFYIDSQLSGYATPESCLPCPLPGYMLLTCEAAEWSGGGSPACIADLPGEMIVDYVRVWDTLPNFTV